MVLGKGPPGGSWHRMDPNLRTLSLSSWMSLPGLDYSKWDELHPETVADIDNVPQTTNNQKTNDCSECAELKSKCRKQRRGNKKNNSNGNIDACHCRCSTTTNSDSSSCSSNSNLCVNNCSNNSKNIHSGTSEQKFNVEVSLQTKNKNVINHLVPPANVPRRNLSVKRQLSKEVQTRALVSRVAKYYEMYVHEMGLTKYFMNDTEVTAVLPLHGRTAGRFKNGRWLVFAKTAQKTHIFVCRNLVLATGASDLANRLGVPDENNRPWVKHDLTQLEDALKQLPEQERSSECVNALCACYDCQ